MRLLSFFRLAILTMAIAGPAHAAGPNVLTDMPITHSLVAQVMGDIGAPALLLEGASDPHHAQLRPSQARALAQADVFFWIGAPLTPWLESKLETLLPANTAHALLEAKSTKVREFEEEHEEHDDHDHGDENIDPHAWLDPDNAQAWLGEIAAVLAEKDPQNAATYAANAKRAQGEISALTTEITAILAPAQSRAFITSHDAFGYLSDRFGLHIEASISDGHANAPGAAGLSALRRLIESEQIDCIFAEAIGTDVQAEQLAADTGLPIAALDPTGALLSPSAALYSQVMRALATQIAKCGAPH